MFTRSRFSIFTFYAADELNSTSTQLDIYSEDLEMGESQIQHSTN